MPEQKGGVPPVTDIDQSGNRVSAAHSRYLRRLRQRKRLVHGLRLLTLIAALGLWELATAWGWLDPFIFSSPSRAAATLWRLGTAGELWRHIGVTLAETLIGFGSGTLLGLAVAVLLWRWPLAQQVCEPYLVVLNSLPKIALGPVIIVWVGAGAGAVVTVTLLISIIATIIGMLNGFMGVEPEKILLLRTFGAGQRQIFAKVVFPASLPTLISVLKIGVGLAWVGVIVGEFLSSQAGLGYLIVYGGQVFRMDLVMAAVLVLCLLAAAMYYLVVLAEQWALGRR